MAAINERINLVFSESGKSKSEIARLLDVAPSYISKLTNTTDAVPSSRLIADISKIFSVSEEWIMTGAGEMHPPRTREQDIGEFFADVLADSPDSIRSVIVTGLARLDVEDWEEIARILHKLTEPPA